MVGLCGDRGDHAKEEEEEFCELLYVLANGDLSSSAEPRYNKSSKTPKWAKRSLQVVPYDAADVESERGDEGGKTSTQTGSAACAVSSPQNAQDGATANLSSWVENLHYALSLNRENWHSHALFAILDLMATVAIAVLLPIMKPLIVHLMKGGRWAIIVSLTPTSLTYFLALYRLFYICTGVWPRRSVLMALMFFSTALRPLGLLLLPVFDVLQALAYMLPWMYLTSDLPLGLDRPTYSRVLLHLGVWLSASPLGIAPILHTLLPTDPSQASVAGHKVNGATWVAMMCWACIGITVHKGGLVAWRHAVRKGARTVKQFEFLVLFEVGFTSTGLQLFSGSAFIPYALWAVFVHLLQICWMSPWFRKFDSAGSTQALHVVRHFVEIITKSVGILIGLFLVVACTCIQRIAHPGCNGVGDTNTKLRAPTIPHGGELPCLVCILLVFASIVTSVLGAVYFIRQLEDTVELSSPWVPSRPKDHEVNAMAKHNPVALLIGVARVCLLRSRTELRILTALYVLSMSDSYFVTSWVENKDFWLEWQPSHSWFHC